MQKGTVFSGEYSPITLLKDMANYSRQLHLSVYSPPLVLLAEISLTNYNPDEQSQAL
jgi:hypothetical protein